MFWMQKNDKKDFNKDSFQIFSNKHEFYDRDINKCILLLRKGIYAFEFVDSREIFDETSLPGKKDFYSSLNMEGIIDIDDSHAKRLFKKW